jgi:hypothetical protein
MSRITVSTEDLTHYLTAFPGEITFGDEPPETVFDRYHAAGYEMVNDGVRLDRQRLLDHVRPARKRARAVRVEVLDALVDGDRFAARYVLTAAMRKGGEIVTEVHMFGRVAPDGRLQSAEQLTRTRRA